MVNFCLSISTVWTRSAETDARAATLRASSSRASSAWVGGAGGVAAGVEAAAGAAAGAASGGLEPAAASGAVVGAGAWAHTRIGMRQQIPTAGMMVRFLIIMGVVGHFLKGRKGMPDHIARRPKT